MTKNTLTELPLFLGVAEMSKTLKISRRTILELCRRGEIPAKKIGREWRIHKDKFLAYTRGNSEDEKSASIIL